MTESRRWTTSDFAYHLPDAQIAQYPAADRGASRLMVVDRTLAPDAPDAFTDAVFTDLPSLMSPGDLLVVNSTKVRHARLPGRTTGGGEAEVLLIHPGTDDTWIAMGRPGRAMRPGKRILLAPDVAVETLAVQEDGLRQVRFVGASAADAMARFGQIPLPPYITRDPTDEDRARYQTVYADRPGSVAAPTAGLHFTDELLDTLRDRGVVVATLDLEVGPGTFKPVETDTITDHPMHEESYHIPEYLAEAIRDCRIRGGSVWAVGTTVVRALESAATADRQVVPGSGATRLMIVPGDTFRVVDHLITNFHLPHTTLLMLVAAFAGYERTMAAYRAAVDRGYRFYSYGDAMCLR